MTILDDDVAPEIDMQSNGVSIVDGDATPSLADHTDFGSVPVVSGSVVRTFTICNTGTAALTLTGTPRVRVSGLQAAEFKVTARPAASVPAGGAVSFQVTFDPAAAGLRRAMVSVANNDADENPCNFAILGTGTAGGGGAAAGGADPAGSVSEGRMTTAVPRIWSSSYLSSDSAADGAFDGDPATLWVGVPGAAPWRLSLDLAAFIDLAAVEVRFAGAPWTNSALVGSADLDR